MQRGIVFVIVIAVLMGFMAAPSAPAVAQSGADGWTVYQLNLRSGPGGDYAIITTLPVNTGLVFEAHNADVSWLLGHTEDGAWRGWVACDYLTYREGFNATQLPASDEIVAEQQAPASGEGDAAAVGEAENAPPANGTLIDMTLIYSSDTGEYYRLTYWSSGLRINGFIGFPRSAGPHPAVIYNRGGYGSTGVLTGIEIIPLVESGFVAAASQYRGCGGSEGGEMLGSGDVDDSLSLVPLLQARPEVDPSKIGMMGGSRGGMVTYLALKADTLSGSSRIKAAVTVGGISDLLAWAEQRPDIIEGVYVPQFGLSPYQSTSPYVERSAVYWPELINAPLLLLHGDADGEVSVEQSRRLYNALQLSGRTAKLIIYDGDDHPLSGHLGGYPAAVDWFAQYFGVGTTYDAHWDAINNTTQWFFQHNP